MFAGRLIEWLMNSLQYSLSLSRLWTAHCCQVTLQKDASFIVLFSSSPSSVCLSWALVQIDRSFSLVSSYHRVTDDACSGSSIVSSSSTDQIVCRSRLIESEREVNNNNNKDRSNDANPLPIVRPRVKAWAERNGRAARTRDLPCVRENNYRHAHLCCSTEHIK